MQSGDTGYDHEGAGDVCGYEGHGHPAQGRAEDAQVALCRTWCGNCAGGAGYLLGVQVGEDVAQVGVDAKHKDVIQKECHLLWKEACPGAALLLPILPNHDRHYALLRDPP